MLTGAIIGGLFAEGNSLNEMFRNYNKLGAFKTDFKLLDGLCEIGEYQAAIYFA